MDIGSNIRHFRKEQKLTQVELASKSNISRSYLGDVEKNRYNPSIETLTNIAEALNISISELLNDNINAQDKIYNQDEELNIIFNEIGKLSPSDRKKLLKIIDAFINN